jgi:ACR3 family arsenite efflux pump ArsB
MLAFITRITKNLIVAIPIAMLLGFAFGLIAPAGWLKSLIVPLTFLMVYPMMVSLQLGKVLEGGDLRVQLLAQAINFGVIPFVAWGLGQIFFADRPFLALGLLLAALLPTSGMTISWTGFAGGNLGAAVKMTVIGLVLGSLATPLYVMALMGASIPIDIGAVFTQIVVIVLLPMLAGHLTRQWLVRRHGQKGFQQDWAPRFPPLSTLGVLGIAFVAIALQARSLVAQPAVLLELAIPLLLLYAANYLISTVVARSTLPRGDAIALVYGTVMRNLSIALALAMNVFGAAGAETALLIALAYIVQIQSAAWYVKASDRLFGPREAAKG